jgi:hypothetical protein
MISSGSPSVSCRAAVQQYGDVTEALPGHRVHDIRVAWVQVHFVDTGITIVELGIAVTIAEHLAPVLAAVRGLEEPPVAAGRPQRTLCGNEDNVRIPRIDADHADVLGILEPHVFPVFAAVEAQVNAGTVTDVPAADVLARADPDRIRVVGVDRHATDRIGILVFEDGFPGRALVDGLPDTAAADADVPGAVVVRVDRDIAR